MTRNRPDLTSHHFLRSLTLIAVLALLFYAPEASAAQAVIDPVNGTICPNWGGFTSRIINCIVTAVTNASANFLLPFSFFLSRTVAACCMLAVILWGVQLAFGKVQHAAGQSVILVIKIVLVLIFSWNFAYFFPALLSLWRWAMDVSAAYAWSSVHSPRCWWSTYMWDRVDCTLDYIVGGIVPWTAWDPCVGGWVSSNIGFGFLGLVAASLSSGPAGLSVAIFGLAFIIMIIKAIAQSVYIFMNSVIGVCLLVIVSPLFIPLTLFKATKDRFDKWLQLMIGLILQPLFLFAYLSMLITALDVVVFSPSNPKSLYRLIGGNAATSMNFLPGHFLMCNGMYARVNSTGMSVNLDPTLYAGNINNMKSTGTFGDVGQWALPNNNDVLGAISAGNNMRVDIPLGVVNYDKIAAYQGISTSDLMIRMIIGMFTAMVIAYIMNTMLQFVPYLGAVVSGEVMSVPNLGGGSLSPDKLLSGAKKLFGGGGSSPGDVPRSGEAAEAVRQQASPGVGKRL